MRLLALLASLLVGCGTWPTGEVCNQRDRILFAGNIANSEAKHCETHDFDGDRVQAPYDQDDRYEDYGDDEFRGDLVGDISQCRDYDPDTVNDDQVEYDWSCIRSYWFVQLDSLCTAWQSGDMSPFEEENLSIEAEAAEVYCVSPDEGSDTAAE